MNVPDSVLSGCGWVGNITNTGCELLLGVNINSSSYGITYIVIGND